jgi:glycosyltransferase involved in cell wall biosynthesis
MGISDSDFLAVFVGRLGKEKNVEELFEYFSDASQSLPSAKLLVVGGGPDAEHLKSYASKLHSSEKIISREWYLPKRYTNINSLATFSSARPQAKRRDLHT